MKMLILLCAACLGLATGCQKTIHDVNNDARRDSQLAGAQAFDLSHP